METDPDVSQPDSAEAMPEQTQATDRILAGKLEEWCRLFVGSPEYRKAMLDARYTRQEAVADFLHGHCQ